MKLLLVLLIVLCFGCSREPQLSPASQAAEQQDSSGIDPFGGGYGTGGTAQQGGGP